MGFKKGSQQLELKFKEWVRSVEWGYGSTLYDIERYVIIETLRSVNWNRTHAAKSLDISIRTLRNKILDYKAEGAEILKSPYGL